jgi:hypothetical protein
MIQYQYIIKPLAQRKIRSFYNNVAKKYRHVYDKNDQKRNVYNALHSIYDIEKTLLRRKPTLERWHGYHMANTDKWYYAYIIQECVIVVLDACHAQNMRSNDINDK